MAREASQLAVYSFIITLINIACIFLMATIVLQIKNIVPIIPDKKIGNCFEIGQLRSWLGLIFSAELWQPAVEKACAGSSNEVPGGNARELVDILETVHGTDGFPKHVI